ncbi:MAG: ABC transporter ATP-binding protein [Proteobacteria bacterium]|nr:ABC transporter ATP-binding protein [Pseudomonadota bacterium]
MNELLKVSNVSFRYGRDLPLALDQVSLTLTPGKIAALIGPNGAGKTTLMSLIAGLLPVTTGSIKVCGHEVGTLPARQHLSFIPQSGAVIDHMTTRENIFFFAQIYCSESAPARTDESIQAMSLEKHAGILARKLSAGTRKRLSFACALVGDPKVLIADEITAGVDPPSRDRILSEIEKLRNQGCAVLYSTHYLHEVARLCDEVIMVCNGRMIDRRETTAYLREGELSLENRFRELAGVELRD